MDETTAKWLFLLFATIATILVFVVIPIIISKNKAKLKEIYTQQASQKEIDTLKHEGVIKDKNLLIEKLQNEMTEQARGLAVVQFEQWKVTELDGYKKKADAAAEFTSKLMLQRWLIENEERIRKDAANRSVRNVMGKVAEHLIPFSEAFSEFNPKDARFIGSPIDLIVFDGIEEKEDEITIYFLEVKTGTSALSPRQKRVMEAVKAKRVEWRRLTIKDFGSDVNDLLTPPALPPS